MKEMKSQEEKPSTAPVEKIQIATLEQVILAKLDTIIELIHQAGKEEE